MDQHTVQIKGKEYPLKYTIESWKQLKAKHGITPMNIQEKMNEDFAGFISGVIFYGLSPENRAAVKAEDIDLAFGFEVMDIVRPAIEAGMPKSAKQDNEGADGPSKK